MLSILDKYIIKRYLGTFVLLLLLFIPIGIIVNLAEKIDKILENEVPFMEVVAYYFDFTIYFANLLFPLFLFLSVIWFTSKLAKHRNYCFFEQRCVLLPFFKTLYYWGYHCVCCSVYSRDVYCSKSKSRL